MASKVGGPEVTRQLCDNKWSAKIMEPEMCEVQKINLLR